ncbi:MAG: pyridoxal phosphate-dependent aminotransferase, partial [Eubacterium sp.]
MKLSQKLETCIPSLTLKLAEQAAAFTAAGESVVRFGTGEPDFITPDYICSGAKAAIDAGHTK